MTCALGEQLRLRKESTKMSARIEKLRELRRETPPSRKHALPSLPNLKEAKMRVTTSPNSMKRTLSRSSMKKMNPFKYLVMSKVM